MVSFEYLGFIAHSLRYSKKEKRFSMSFGLKHWWNLAIYIYIYMYLYNIYIYILFKLLVRAHKLYNI